MCAVGVCAMKGGGKSCSSGDQSAKASADPTEITNPRDDAYSAPIDLFKAEFPPTDARSSPELHRPTGEIDVPLQTKGSELKTRTLKKLLHQTGVLPALAGRQAV